MRKRESAHQPKDQTKTLARIRGRYTFMKKYKLVVGGIGMVFEGDSRSEANRWFRQFVLQSKEAKCQSAEESLTLFKNYNIIREYRSPDSLAL
jgi:hypothetical protein